MKQILAVFLTLAMVLNIAPVGALAASDSDAASIQAVAETEESLSSALDEETARAIASDPFLQRADSAPEEQQQQAKVDTSDVSVTATNSFGQLLVNGMEAQNSTSESYTDRVTNLTMNGHTANVEFVLDGTADLVVAIYTDSDAEEMVASGTVTVTGSGNETAKVTISGDIPETYTVKAFLLDTTEHAPLSAVYTDVSHTQVMVDLDKATVDDFPADRVINLDDQDNTNFAVVSQEATLLTYQDNTAGENQLLSEDDASLVYTFGNASAEIKNLQPGDILTYEYAPGELLIARVQDISVNGDAVTISGDDTLELTDVFDMLKIEESASSGELIPREEGMDPAVTYLGTGVKSDTENGFKIEDGGIHDDVPILDITTHEFSLDGKIMNEEGTASVTANGTISLSANINFAYYIAFGEQWVALSSQVGVSGKVSIKGAINGKIPLAPLETPKALKQIGLEAEITPNFIVELSGAFSFKYSYEQYTAFGYSSKNGFQDLSRPGSGSIEPVTDENEDMTAVISVFVGLEIGPKLRVGKEGKEWLLVEFKLRGGGQADAKRTVSTDEVRHECEQCLYFTESVIGKLTIRLVILKKDLASVGVPKEIKLLDWQVADQYWSLTYKEVGFGTCPHMAYRVQVSLEDLSEPDIAIYEKKTDGTQVELGKTDATGVAKLYLATGQYDLTASAGGQTYDETVKVDGAATEVMLKKKISSPDNPDPDPEPDPEPKPDPEPDPEDGKVIASGSCGAQGDNVWCKLYENGHLVIGGTGEMKNYDRYEVYGGYEVETPWYEVRGSILTITIQEDVTSIGDNTFYECYNLTSIVIPDGVTRIGYGAFGYCSSLTSIVIPDGVTSIGDEAFQGCSSLTSIVIPDGVTRIGYGAFGYCSSLTSIVIPDGVTSIGYTAFYACNSLMSIVLPSSVTSIEDFAFQGCSSLTSIVIPASVTYIGGNAFRDCSSLTSIVIPDGVTSIEDYAFYNCSSLTSIVIPGSVTSIGSHAFYNCSSLTSIVIPGSVTYIGGDAFRDCSSLTSIVIPGSVTSIRDYAFQDCSSLTSIVISDGVTSIRDYAFYNCSSLTSIVIPGSVTSIGHYAFYNCSSLTSIVISDGVTNIGWWAFQGCSNLTSIVLPASVRYIGDFAFYNCSSLKNVMYHGTMAQWEAISIRFSNDSLYSTTIHCTDGDIVPDSENSISTGTTTTKDSKFAATFSDVKANKEYVVIVSRSERDPLNADNLLYIDQITAQADGELAVPFVTTAGTGEMQYIVACARDDSTPDQPDNPDQPSDPGDTPASDGGDITGAVILVGGIVAVAAVAGIVLAMPVDVQGTVKLADKPVVNATVQVMQGDNVAAQTTTNADGWFAVKVRRGSYTLRVTWTDAEGNPVTRTVDFKAPDKSLNIAA